MSDNTSAAESWTQPPAGTPCWIEIPATDVQACKKFYAALFPSWTWKPSTDKHPDDKHAGLSFSGSTGLSGGIVQISAGCKSTEQKDGSGMTVFIFVDSLEETQKRIEELGGSTTGEKHMEGESGCYMYFKDVEGNRVGAYEIRKA